MPQSHLSEETMAKAAVTKRHHFMIQKLLILLSYGYTNGLDDAHSLRCNLTIKDPTPADPLWYEAKCLVDEILILHLSNINKTMTSGDPGETANATEVGECLTQPLKDLCQKLRNKVSNTKVDTHKTNGYPHLQVTMIYLQSQGQIPSATWEFNISDSYFFTFYTENMSWRSANDESGVIMNKWKDDGEFVKRLKFLIPECRQEVDEFLKQPKEKPRSTSRSPSITQLTSTSPLPPPSHSTSKKGFISVGLIFISLLFAFAFAM